MNATQANETQIAGAFCGGLDWQAYVELVLVPIFTAFGLVGNSVSFVVLCMPLYNKRSYSFYLRALAVFDSLTLVITLVVTVNNAAFSIGSIHYLTHHTTLTCKLSEYLRHIVYLMSSWLIVCFTVDRYIAVCHPLHRGRLCTSTFAIKTLVVLFIVISAAQTYTLVYVDQVDRSGPTLCHAQKNERLVYMALYYFLFSFSLRFALPFVIIVSLNCFIAYNIQKVKFRRLPQGLLERRRANLAIYTLFVVCVVFILTLLPNAAIATIQFISFAVYQSSELYCPLKTLDSPFQMLRLVNYSCNFILYGMTGRQFRAEVAKLFRGCFKIRRQNTQQDHELLPQGRRH